MTLSLKKLDLICLSTVIVVTIMCGGWAISHTTKQKRQMHLENDLLSRELMDLNLADANLQQLKTVLDTTRIELASLNEQIPDTSKIGEFLKITDALMKEKEIEMINLRPLPPVQKRLYIKNPIQLMFRGPFIKVYQLLNDLENMNRTLVMEKMTVTKSNMANECQVDLIVNIFER